MSPPDALAHVPDPDGLTLEQLADLRGKLEHDYQQAAAALEPHIERAVTESRINGATWDAIGNLLNLHKDTARRTYQDATVGRGAPGPRIERCGLQHAEAAGWCRNGVAGIVGRADGNGPGMNICRPHGEDGVASGKYVWRDGPHPRKRRRAREATE